MRHAMARACMVALVLSTGSLAGDLPAAGGQAARTAEIRIDNFSFVPSVLKVAPGTTVTWVNADDVPHVVRTEDGAVKSPPLDTDGTFSHTFDRKGTYPYFCSLHPKMTGKIIVE